MSPKSKPLISILIPLYNNVKFIEEAIDSAFSQTYPNIEVLVLDDGSTDGSKERVEKLAQKYKNLSHLSRENKGVCASLNELLALSNGEYVRIIGSDDVLTKDSVELLYNHISKDDSVGLVSGLSIIINQKGQKVEQKNDDKTGGFKDILFKKMIRRNCICSPSILFRKSIIEKVGLFDEKLRLEDWDYWLRILNAGFKIHEIQRNVIQYRVHETNTSKNLMLMLESTALTLKKWKHIPNYEKSVNAFCKHEILDVIKNNRKYNFEEIKALLSDFFPSFKLSPLDIVFWRKLLYRQLKYRIIKQR